MNVGKGLCMKDSTRKIIEAAVAADGSIEEAAARLAFDILACDRPVAMVQPSPVTMDSVMSRTEVARVLGLAPHSVDRYARSGALRRVTMPGGKVSLGISRESVMRVLQGNTGK